MARPFGPYEDSEEEEGKEKAQNKDSGRGSNSPSKRNRSNNKRTETSSECSGTSTRDQPDGAVTNVYCISNSKHVTCGPTFVSVINNGHRRSDRLANSSNEKPDIERKIKVRKGVLTSNRNITLGDIQMVAKYIEKDWKELLKKLPGVTSNNTRFHQAFVNAMDRKDSTNMAEIALSTWKTVLPELSTIGNLAKALFNIGHPDVVTRLKP